MFELLKKEVEKHFKEKEAQDFPKLGIDIPIDYQKFNDMIGYPINRNTNLPQKMTPYQIEYNRLVNEHHKIIINKTRKGGFTDAHIRTIAQNIFGRYAGHDTMIVAGNELIISREILRRFNELFEHGFTDKKGKHWTYGDLIIKYVTHPQPVVEFYNGARVFCFAAIKSGQYQSFRGTDDIISIFLSEAAHIGLTDDSVIYDALYPNLANRDHGDFVIESTPNGRRGFFYDVWQNAIKRKNAFYPYQVNYVEPVRCGVLSKKFIEEQKQDSGIDFEQEYCCKFTTSKRATFTEDMIRGLSHDKKCIDLAEMLGYKKNHKGKNIQR